MKKREKKLAISRETLHALEEGADMMEEVVGGRHPHLNLKASCTRDPSTRGGTLC